MSKLGATGHAVTGGINLMAAGLWGLLAVAIIAGAASQGSTIGVLAGVALLLAASYRVINVVFWTSQDMSRSLQTRSASVNGGADNS